MAVFDATALLHVLEPGARAIVDPTTGEPLADASARIKHLVETLEQNGEKIVIPTPALSEVLVHADEAAEGYLEVLGKSVRFRIAPFDERAAVELAVITREAIRKGDLRAGTDLTRAKLKFDRQIIAIARVAGESVIYSDDTGVAALGSALGLRVIRTYNLPSPPSEQTSLTYDTPDTSSEPGSS